MCSAAKVAGEHHKIPQEIPVGDQLTLGDLHSIATLRWTR